MNTARIKRQLIETDAAPVEIEPVRFAHEGGGPHWACACCLATIDAAGDLVHARLCDAAMSMPRIEGR